MMLSVMVVGAGAAFSDQSKIKNTEAVDACTALNIIGGYPDGSFKPEGNITRAEVTKMICVALNGGKEPNLATNATPTFSDVRTNANSAWAEKYIESCVAQGIVSGVGGGKFAPAGNVTGTQLAKMLLVSLGYKADVQNFTGNAWATNVNVLATQKGLYKGLESMDPAAALTRDNAAQMIWNALQAKEVEYKYTLVTENGNLTSKVTVEDKQVNGNTITLLADKYEAEDDFEGTLVSYKWDDKDKEFDYEVLVTDSNVEKDVAGVQKGVSYKFSTTADYTDLFGLNVKVIYKTNKDKDVYGIFANDSAVLAKGVIDDLEAYDNDTIKFDGVKYDTDANVALTDLPVVKENQWPINDNNKYTATISDTYTDSISKAATAKLIDADNDGEADYVVYLPFTVAKVTYAGSSSITAGKSYKHADENIADGIAKDDYVMIVDKANTKDDKYAITKAEKVTGKIEAIKGTDVKVGDTWYKTDSNKTGDAYSLNDEFELAVVNGFVFNAEKDGGSISNDTILFVTAVDEPKTEGIGEGTQKVKAMFSDGTEKEITVAQLWSSRDYADMGENNAAKKNTLYTFTTKSNGEYKLKALSEDAGKYDDFAVANSDTAEAATNSKTALTSIQDGKATFTIKDNEGTATTKTMRFNDNATIFVVGKDNKVLTGKAVGNWKQADAALKSGSALYAEKDGGFNYVTVGCIVLADNAVTPSTGDTSYAYVLADSTLVKNGDDYYVSMKVWDGAKSIDVMAKTDSSDNEFSKETDVSNAPYTKGSVISYNVVDDKTIDTVTDISSKASAVSAWDGKKYLYSTTDNKELEITSDTIKIFIDSEDTEGRTDGAITEANEVEGVYVKNAYVIADGDEVEAIIVDVNNNLDANKGESDVSLKVNGTVAGITDTDIDNTKHTISLAHGASIGVTNFIVAGTTNNVQAVNAISVKVIRNGKVITSGNLKNKDIVRVVAENGDVVEYTVTIAAE